MNWGYYIVSTANTASEENEALIRSMKFSGVGSFLYKSIIQLYMEYCFHLAGATTRYFHMLDKLQKRVCSTLSTAFEPLGHRQTSLSLFCRYYFDRYSSELAELVPLPYSHGRSTAYYKDANVNSFFPQAARYWNSLSAECFSLMTIKINRSFNIVE